MKRDKRKAHPVFLFMVKYEQRLTLKALDEADRPREKLISKGRRHLSDAELLAILIGSGNKDETAVELCQRILLSYDSDLKALGEVSVQELARFKGMGEAKSLAIIAALEISRRRKELSKKHKPQIKSSSDAAAVLSAVFSDLDHEEFWILILNTSNSVTGRQMISKGGMASTVADPKMIFKSAIELKAAAIILAHNHPSGNLEASEQDIAVTQKMIAAGRLLDIPVLDHLIFTNDGYTSLADTGTI